ncbi:MAG: DUF3795 domain-containing protein [Spirochaetes bacterium]|nr:DUF3795 domain-containing protein [Spirochaetota bacterium]
MEKMYGLCGMECSGCPAYLATQQNDDAARARVAAMWSKMFHAEIKPSDINCDGCLSGSGRLFGHCNKCEVRLCGMDKKLGTCAECGSYSCAKLEGLLSFLPKTARENLEALRSR